MAIAVQVRLNAILKNYSPIEGQSSFQLSLPEKSCIEDAVAALQLPRDKVGLASVNAKYAEFSHSLAEGDEIVLFPRLPFGG